MAWRHAACPLLSPATLPNDPWRQLPGNSCPPGVSAQLAANNLRANEDTVRDGNCGVHAFVISLLDQMRRAGSTSNGRGAEAKRRRELKATRCDGQVAQARAAGVAWIRANAQRLVWDGMTVAQLCKLVSGQEHREYIEKVGRDGQWADTAFLHALGCAYGADVYVFQEGMDIALLGPCLCQTGESHNQAVPIMVPVALVNNHHFWGVTQEDPTPIAPVDKGDLPVLMDDQATSPCKRRRLDTPGDEAGDEEDGVDMMPYYQRQQEATAREQALPEHALQAELSLCRALARWCPWSEPSAEICSAAQAVETAGATARDVGNACLARAEALRQMIYEEEHGPQLPEAFKYQRAVRYRLNNPGAWKQTLVADTRYVTQSYLSARAAVPTLANMTSVLVGAKCSRHEQAHEPGNKNCVGTDSFAATVVINWRVLWWSLPKTSRKEHLLRTFRASLTDHLAAGGKADRWRMRYHFCGQPVCRDGFMVLTGVGAHSCQEARTAALEGKVCWVSRAELGLAASIRNSSKFPVYLGARQWLEWYAVVYAERSPMGPLAYLPAGRKTFYYQHYRNDMLRRARTMAGVYTPATDPDSQVAEESTFLKAWRIEVPWLVVCKSVSMFTRCSVCEYLKLLKEQTPKEQAALRECIDSRLGSHFEFQAAQRLAHGRVEEECAQSGGQKWLMIIDKMDQKKTVVPTIWSQLPTPLFKDPERRVIAGMLGSMWYGTAKTTHHLRTVFTDCSHGSEMQSSAILWNLNAIAQDEGHLPNTFVIAADNTRKETKNQITMWFLIWLLCALEGTPLCQIDVIFLLVGHTHNQLDRFFSRLGAAIAGQDYFTVPGLLALARERLRHCSVQSGHLAQVWEWKALMNQSAVHAMHNLDPAHAFRFSRSTAGIHMQWKQWCTDEHWGSPVLVVRASDMLELGGFRPAKAAMEFPGQGKAILDWVDRFENWCAQPGGKYIDLQAEFAWLRQAVHHTAPGEYSPGADVQTLIQELRQLPGTRPEGTSSQGNFPQDIITQLFPNADIPTVPVECLVRIDGITHTRAGQAMRSNAIYPGSTLVIRVPRDTMVYNHSVPFLCAVAVETSRSRAEAGQIAVVWYLPKLAAEETFRPLTGQSVP